MKISSEYRKSLVYTSLFMAAYLSCLAVFALHRSCWRDECHFVETIVQFEYAGNFSTLLHYNEMSTPLPFIVYALWGKLVGDSLISFRLFSLCIAALTFLAFHSLFFLILRKRLVSFLLVVFLAGNPYMAGASIFVFTDMLMMLSLSLFMIGIVRHNRWLLFFSSMAGLLCRQYFVFAVGAGILYFILAWIQDKKKTHSLWCAGMLLASMIPLMALFALWHGFSPDNAVKGSNLSGGTQFHMNSLTLYITMISVYSLPLLIIYRKCFYQKRGLLLLSPVLGIMYWFFPIVPSVIALGHNVPTIGFFHRLLRIWPGAGLEHYVFFAFFTLALPVCLQISVDMVNRIIRRRIDFLVFLGLAVVSFLAVMPFSYLHWEKYFLPLLPVIALYGATAKNSERPAFQMEIDDRLRAAAKNRMLSSSNRA